jgi:RNA polymerase sigma factor (sigma-70 family)
MRLDLADLRCHPPGLVRSKEHPPGATAPSLFATTHWSVVLAAGRRDTPRAQAALEELCRRYWLPLYYFLRRRGSSPEDAEDLTQELFARLLQRGAVAKADPRRGRFRSFLLVSMKNLLADEWDKARALKRGGGPALTLDFQSEETRLQAEPADPTAPDKAFDRRWALALLDQVYRRLEEEFRQQGKAGQFAVLRVALAGGPEAAPCADLGRQLGLTEGATRVAVHRLRRRYREVLRELIADTVSAPEEIEDELRHLLQVLSE